MQLNCFTPTDMYQYFNTSLNFEFMFLLSPAKIGVFGRSDPPNLKSIPKSIRGERKDFTAYFIVDFLDVLGVFRRLELYQEFCTAEDYKLMSKTLIKKDLLDRFIPNESVHIEKEVCSFLRNVPFDIDDDIIVTPNFVTR